MSKRPAGNGTIRGISGPKLFSELAITIRAGERIALGGPSGTGKTTLGNILLRLLPPDTGHVHQAGALRGRVPLRDSFGDVIRRHRAEAGTPEELLAALRPAPALLHRMHGQVSGGELQRLAIIRSMLLEPALVFADEPTSRLDLITQEETISSLPLPAGRPRTLPFPQRTTGGKTLKRIFRSSLTATLLLAVASCAAPAGTAPAGPGTTGAGSSASPPVTAGTTAELQTFTFPDGHISFTYPAGWTVRTGQGPYLDEETKPSSVEATVMDGSGKEVVRVLSGLYGDGAAGPVERTVLDHAPVPGLTEAAGKPVEFGFARDEIPGVDSYYFMDVRLAGEFMPSQTESGTNQVSLPNGMMAAYVVLDPGQEPEAAVPDSGKAWMGTEEYAQLKALLLSLKYT